MKDICYTDHENSYCYYLSRRMKQLCYLLHESGCTTVGYRKTVYKIIEDAVWTPKKVEFISKVCDMDSKAKIYLYIKNSINKADRTFVPCA